MGAPKPELCEQEKERLISQCLPFIKYTAHRLARRLPPRISVNDLIQVGIMGMLEALQRYRPGEAKLKTFAEYRIKGAMLDELRCQEWLPRSLRDKVKQIRNARHGLEHELSRAPDDEEVAAQVNMSLAEYYRSLQCANDAVVFSFEDFGERTQREGSLNVTECLWDRTARSPLELLEEAGDREGLECLIRELPEREKLLLSLYYWDELTMKEIGKVMKLSEGRICQIHAHVLARLNASLRGSATPA